MQFRGANQLMHCLNVFRNTLRQQKISDLLTLKRYASFKQLSRHLILRYLAIEHVENQL